MMRSSALGLLLLSSTAALAQTPLASGPSVDWFPAWSPDGTRIVFASDRAGNFDLWTATPDGGNLTQLTRHGATDWDPAWSPDGKRIAFVSHRSGNPDIWVMDADGSNLRQLTADPAEDSDPAWSPDGRSILFSSKRRWGNFDLYVMDASGGGVTPLTVDPRDDVVIPGRLEVRNPEAVQQLEIPVARVVAAAEGEPLPGQRVHLDGEAAVGDPAQILLQGDGDPVPHVRAILTVPRVHPAGVRAAEGPVVEVGGDYGDDEEVVVLAVCDASRLRGPKCAVEQTRHE